MSGRYAAIGRAVGHATLVINAANVTSTSQDAITRVIDGFHGTCRDAIPPGVPVSLSLHTLQAKMLG